MHEDWSQEEVRLIVEDYFKMLQLELVHAKYNKTQHRRYLMPLLNKRSEGSVEFKHQNISAALINMGLPYINGYKPRSRYQKQLLEKEIATYIEQYKPILEEKFIQFSDEKVIQNVAQINLDDIIDSAPVISNEEETEPLFRPIKINYLEREQNNRLLGEQGEDLVIQFEKQRLINIGKESLSDKIEWVSKEVGDGLGFDILSRNTNGTDRYIEVKTTKLSKETPIYLTKTELSFAQKKEGEFYLYRVFNFKKQPRIFIKNGKYEGYCNLSPQTFKGYFFR